MEDRKGIALLSENVGLAETLQLGLEEEGYDVIQLAGLGGDLQTIIAKHIGVLILDLDNFVWRMEFVKEAKKRNPMLSIILLSSIEEDLTRFLVSEIEVVKSFIKPFELEEFSNSIKSLLNC